MPNTNEIPVMDQIKIYLDTINSQNTVNINEDLKKDSDTCLQEIANIYYHVGKVMEEISADCVLYGKNNILSSLDPMGAAIYGGILNNILGVWSSFSAYELPNLPDEPVVVENFEGDDV